MWISATEYNASQAHAASPAAAKTGQQSDAAAPPASPQATPGAQPSSGAHSAAGPAAPPTNPAVQRCSSAYRKALVAAGGPKGTGARDAAESAFRENLPDLVDRASAADFIACVVKGIALNVFWKQEGPRLILGAKAAAALFPSPWHHDRLKPGPKPKQ